MVLIDVVAVYIFLPVTLLLRIFQHSGFKPLFFCIYLLRKKLNVWKWRKLCGDAIVEIIRDQKCGLDVQLCLEFFLITAYVCIAQNVRLLPTVFDSLVFIFFAQVACWMLYRYFTEIFDKDKLGTDLHKSNAGINTVCLLTTCMLLRQ